MLSPGEAGPLRVLDLFSGIGGFSLGLERAGMRTVAFCEIEPYARAVLKKHWPDVPCYEDVTKLTAEGLRKDGIEFEVVVGGFPCQDISLAGRGRGLSGERSALWWEMHRIVAETRPSWLVVENVSALRSRGLDAVLGSLAALGYDAEWHCIPASAVGAPHQRDRVWIVANAARLQQGRQEQRAKRQRAGAGGEPVATTNTLRDQLRQQPGRGGGARGAGAAQPAEHGEAWDVADARRHSTERHGPSIREIGQRDWWLAEPDVGRVAHGIPARVDRLRCLGNAVVPQITEAIGRAIVAAHDAATAPLPHPAHSPP